MVQQVVMPKLGQTVEESTIVRWHKSEGDQVKKGDVLFEIETDKAVLESPSFYDGTLLKIVVPQGQTVPVKSVVAFIGAPGEQVPEVGRPRPAAARPGKSPTPSPSVPRNMPSSPTVQATIAEPLLPTAARSDILRVSPRARRLARSKAIDPRRITGSGPQGRILENDVVGYLQDSGYHRLRMTPAARELASREGIDVLDVSGSSPGGKILVEDIREAIRARPQPMSRMRQVIADRLSRSFNTAPHFYVSILVDVSDLLSLRARLKAEGKRYTLNDFILRAVIEALIEFPTVNSVTPDGRDISLRRKVHLGVAVALDEGLVVPVIRNAHLMGLGQLHQHASDLALKAREGRLTPDEMSGGTFTVSNMGMLDVDDFTAIINPGESAIVAVSTARRTPVAIDDQMVVRTLMRMTFSFDHRVVDGALGARFANAVRARLEEIEKWKSLT